MLVVPNLRTTHVESTNRLTTGPSNAMEASWESVQWQETLPKVWYRSWSWLVGPHGEHLLAVKWYRQIWVEQIWTDLMGDTCRISGRRISLASPSASCGEEIEELCKALAVAEEVGPRKMGSDQSWKNGHAHYDDCRQKKCYDGIWHGMWHRIWHQISSNMISDLMQCDGIYIYVYIYPNHTKFINIIWVWLKTVNSTHPLHGNFKRDTVMMDNHQWISGHPLLKQLTLTVSKPWNHGEHQNYQRADVHPFFF